MIVYYLPYPEPNDPEPEEEEEEDQEDVQEEYTLLTYMVGGALLVMLVAAIWVLRWDTQYSIACGAWYDPRRFFKLAFVFRFFILLVSTLLVGLNADAVTLLLYLAIVYCTIFHDIFFRRDCPPDAMDQVTKAAQKVVEASVKIVSEGVQGVGRSVSAMAQKGMELAQQVGSKISDAKSYIEQHGHELTDSARSQLVAQLKTLESALTGLSEALLSGSEEILSGAIEETQFIYETTQDLLGKIVSGIMYYFAGPRASSARSGEEWRVGSFFERVDQEVTDLFERAEQEAKKQKRAGMRREAGGVELQDVTVGEMFQQWFGGKDENDILDQRLAKELGVSDVKDLPADLPKMLVNEYATPDRSWDPIEKKWVPARRGSGE